MDHSSLLGLLPLLVYIALCFTKYGQIVAVCAGIISAAIIGGHGIVDIATAVRAGLGSFLGYIGMIILLGGGLGMILKKTGVVHYMVAFVTGRFKINDQRKARFVIMLSSVIIVSLLGTMAGGNAILAPILIPIAASVGIVPNTMAVLLHGAGATGLFLGPFTPPVVALTEFTGISYPQFLLNAGIPISVIMWIVTFCWAGHVQKKYQGLNSYQGEEEDASELDKWLDSPKARMASIVFITVMFGMVTWGIIIKGGSTFVIAIMLITAVLTGLAGGLGINGIIDGMCEGAKNLIWLFFFFVLLDPFINFISDAGAFKAVADLFAPYAAACGKVGFVAMTTLVGVFGVPGAAVAQAEVLNKMFLTLAQQLDIPMTVWVIVLLVGSQMTSFAIPEGDMQGQMGLARSKDLKSVLCNGWIIVFFTTCYAIFRAILL